MKGGLGTQIIKLLMPWINPITFLLASVIAYEFGMLGLLVFAFITAVSFLIIFFISKRPITFVKDIQLRKVIYIIFVTEIFIIILLVSKKIILGLHKGYFSIIYILITVLLVSIFYIGNRSKNWISNSIVVLGLIISFLIPTVSYLKVGIPTVYSGLYYLDADMLTFNLKHVWTSFIVWAIIVTIHQYLFYFHYMKNGVSKLNNKSLLISSLICMIIPISAGSLAFLAKASVLWVDSVDNVSLLIIYEYGGSFGKILFVIISLFILINLFLKVGASLGTYGFKGKLEILYFLTIPIIVVTALDISILNVFLFFAVFWGPLISMILFAGNLNQGLKVSYTIGVITALLTMHVSTLPFAIILSCLSTALILLSFKVIRWLSKK